MPYKHQKDAIHYIKNAPADEHFNHVKVHDLHEKPAVHETEHLVSAFGELKAGEPVSTHYPGPTVAYVIEGEAEFEDQSKPGERFTVRAGDVLHVQKDSHITWKTAHSAKVFGATYVPTSVQSGIDLVIKN